MTAILSRARAAVTARARVAGGAPSQAGRRPAAHPDRLTTPVTAVAGNRAARCGRGPAVCLVSPAPSTGTAPGP